MISVSVCLSVRDHISVTTTSSGSSTNFFMHITYSRGSVLPWRRSDKLRISGFYLRDDMLARILAMAMCPSVCVCLSITSRRSIEMDERSNLFSGMGASFDQSYNVF